MWCWLHLINQPKVISQNMAHLLQRHGEYFANVSRALQNIISKFVYCRNRTSYKNFELELFQLELLTINVTSGIVYFRGIILESSRKVSEAPPWWHLYASVNWLVIGSGSPVITWTNGDLFSTEALWISFIIKLIKTSIFKCICLSNVRNVVASEMRFGNSMWPDGCFITLGQLTKWVFARL